MANETDRVRAALAAPGPVATTFGYRVDYAKDPGSLLNALCDKYGTDKGEIATSGHPYTWYSHSYADYFERLYAHCREHVRAVFECGIGTNDPDRPSSMGATGVPGASLRMWREYFPNAEIYGADVDPNILFADDRIRTFQVDQTSPDSIAAMWRQIGRRDFDLIIDDGLHTFEAARILFENSFEYLRPSGLYIIEDMFEPDMNDFKAWFSGRAYRVDFVALDRPGLPLYDNSIVVVRKQD